MHMCIRLTHACALRVYTQAEAQMRWKMAAAEAKCCAIEGRLQQMHRTLARATHLRAGAASHPDRAAAASTVKALQL